MLVAATSPDSAYVVNAITFLFSAALILRIPKHLLQVAQASTEGHWRDIAAGLRLIGSSRALLTVLIAWNVGMLGNAGVNVGEVVLAKVSFNAGDFGYGLLLATAGFGLVFGSLSAGVWLERRDLPRVYSGGFVLMAIGIGLAAAAPNVWIAAACVIVSGVGNGVAVVCNAVLVQRGAPDAMRGRVFTVLMSSNYAVLGLGMVLAGPLTNEFGARWVWGVSACLSALAALVGYGLARGIRSPVIEAQRRRRGRHLTWRVAASGPARRSPRECARATGARSPGRSRSSRTATRSPTSSSARCTRRRARRTSSGSPGRPASASRA